MHCTGEEAGWTPWHSWHCDKHLCMQALERQTQDQQPTSSPGPLLRGSNGHSMKTNPLFSEVRQCAQHSFLPCVAS